MKTFSTRDTNRNASLNDLKDMLASLPGMQETKEKLSLHLSMAEKCMELFENKKLPLTAWVEQVHLTPPFSAAGESGYSGSQ